METGQKVCFQALITWAYVSSSSAGPLKNDNKIYSINGTSMSKKEACYLDSNNFMKASSLRDCLTILGADSSFKQIDYIETQYGHQNYLEKVCQSIYPGLKYDSRRTEHQPDKCPSYEDGWMYPSHCSNGWLDCDSTKNGCLWPNYAGFYCKGNIPSTTSEATSTIITTITSTTSDVDDCASSPCLNGGTCYDDVNSYTCECVPGYNGSNCEIDIDDCVPNPCLNGGTCHDGVNSYACECVPGYEGVNCGIDIDECTSNPCQNGGTCHDDVNAFTCECVNGYVGNNCEIDFDECASSPCQNGGTCHDRINSFTCSCVAGYKGNNCEIEVFVWGPKTGCESGYVQPATAEDCRAVAEASNVLYWGGAGHSSDADPQGCIYRTPDNDIYFNTHSTGSTDRNDRRTVCVKGDTILPSNYQIM